MDKGRVVQKSVADLDVCLDRLGFDGGKLGAVVRVDWQGVIHANEPGVAPHGCPDAYSGKVRVMEMGEVVRSGAAGMCCKRCERRIVNRSPELRLVREMLDLLASVKFEASSDPYELAERLPKLSGAVVQLGKIMIRSTTSVKNRVLIDNLFNYVSAEIKARRAEALTAIRSEGVRAVLVEQAIEWKRGKGGGRYRNVGKNAEVVFGLPGWLALIATMSTRLKPYLLSFSIGDSNVCIAPYPVFRLMEMELSDFSSTVVGKREDAMALAETAMALWDPEDRNAGLTSFSDAIVAARACISRARLRSSSISACG